MTKPILFVIVELVLAIVLAIIIFKSWKYFFQCLVSFLFGHGFIFWRKLWELHHKRSMIFCLYIIVMVLASIPVGLVIKYWVRL